MYLRSSGDDGVEQDSKHPGVLADPGYEVLSVKEFNVTLTTTYVVVHDLPAVERCLVVPPIRQGAEAKERNALV